MILHCPLCHAHFSLEALTQDAAARELLGMRATMPPSLVSYLSLFRSETRALTWERALKLAKEALQLTGDPAQLEAALVETVEALRQKRDQGGAKPLKNHNYLKRVLESIPAGHTSALTLTSPNRQTSQTSPSKTASAIGALENWKHQ